VNLKFYSSILNAIWQRARPFADFSNTSQILYGSRHTCLSLPLFHFAAGGISIFPILLQEALAWLLQKSGESCFFWSLNKAAKQSQTYHSYVRILKLFTGAHLIHCNHNIIHNLKSMPILFIVIVYLKTLKY